MHRSAFLVCLAVSLVAGRAEAVFHLWDISEVFTDADGTVQFIEFVAPPAPGGNFQNLLLDHTIVTEEVGIVVLPLETYTFSGNLPSTATGGRRFLIATPAFAVFGLSTSPFDHAAYLAGSMASIAQPSRAT